MKLPKRFALSTLLLLMFVVSAGCTQPVAQVTTTDIKKKLSEYSELLSRMVQLVREDKMEVDYGQYVGVMQPNPAIRPGALLKVLRDKGLPLNDVMFDKTDGQLTVNFLVEGWNSMRLAYTNGTKPKEMILLCTECPTQSFEPISDGWFVGIIDDSAVVDER